MPLHELATSVAPIRAGCNLSRTAPPRGRATERAMTQSPRGTPPTKYCRPCICSGPGLTSDCSALFVFTRTCVSLLPGLTYSLLGDKIVRAPIRSVVRQLENGAFISVNLDALHKSFIVEFAEYVLHVPVAECDVVVVYQAAVDLFRAERDLVLHEKLEYHIPGLLFDHVIRFIRDNNITFGCVSPVIVRGALLLRHRCYYRHKDISALLSVIAKHGSHERIGAFPKRRAERVHARPTLLGVPGRTMQHRNLTQHKGDESFDSLADCKQSQPALGGAEVGYASL